VSSNTSVSSPTATTDKRAAATAAAAANVTAAAAAAQTAPAPTEAANFSTTTTTVTTTTTDSHNNSVNDPCDMTSLEILNKCHLDLFPKKPTVCDDEKCMAVVDQVPILNGEFIQFIGKTSFDTLVVVLPKIRKNCSWIFWIDWIKLMFKKTHIIINKECCQNLLF
jgi:hypothetical protein